MNYAVLSHSHFLKELSWVEYPAIFIRHPIPGIPHASRPEGEFDL